MPLQIALGDAHGLNTLEHQPVKVAAMEGLWETQARAPAVLFAITDSSSGVATTSRSPFRALRVFTSTHDVNGVVKGLKAFPAGDRPPVRDRSGPSGSW